MSEMIERVAEAVWKNRATFIKAGDSYARMMNIPSRGDATFADLEEPMRERLREEVRAAIEAMRDPILSMVIAAWNADHMSIESFKPDFGPKLPDEKPGTVGCELDHCNEGANVILAIWRAMIDEMLS